MNAPAEPGRTWAGFWKGMAIAFAVGVVLGVVNYFYPAFGKYFFPSWFLGR